MPGLYKVENRYTNELEQAGLDLRVGWSEDLSRKFAELAHRRLPIAKRPRLLAETQEGLEQWYQDESPMVYSLGKRATLLAEAHFLAEPVPELSAYYEFAATVEHKKVDPGLTKALFRAVHYDFERLSRYEGATWAETPHDDPATRAYEEAGYSKVESKNDTTLWVRRPAHES